MFDKWQEILATLSKNRLRTFLTAFSVAWGIFILIILLGTGEGMRNGTAKMFEGDSQNAIWVEGGQTGIAYAGLKPGRKIQLTNEDYDLIKQKVAGIPKITSNFDVIVKTISYKNERGSYQVRSCQTDHPFLEKISMVSGRFVNKIDMAQYRKVCAIGEPVKEALFKTEDPIGKYVDMDGIKYEVVGVFHDPGRGDMNRLYIPLSTAQRSYNNKTNVNVIWASTGSATVAEGNVIKEEIRKMMATKHRFSIDDEKAIELTNNAENFKRIMNLLAGINVFIWIIGIGTIIAGVVGVSNIMMIAVKERTKEIGVRKAIGATPFSIVSMILQEAVLITGLAGYVGLTAGVLVLEAVNKFLPPSDFFRNPQVDLTVAIMATILLIIAGALAGLFPSLRASRIEPVVALRDE